jgi:acetone carboxylase gamma subunit
MKCQCGFSDETKAWAEITIYDIHHPEIIYKSPKDKSGNRSIGMEIELFACPDCGLIYTRENYNNA